MTPEIVNSFSDLPTLPGGLAEARQARLFRALSQFIVAPATKNGLMFVIDDIQWADHVTLQFLHHLAHHIATQPILLVCTYRTEEVATDEQLTEAIQNLQREPHASHILLSRLSVADASSFVELLPAAPHITALGQWLHRETDGNPFFLMSILQSLRERGVLTPEAEAGWQIDLHSLESADTRLRLPEALRQSVLDRLRRVPPPARRILDVAAVYGRCFDFATLQAMTGESPGTLLDVVEELMIRQLLREEEEGRTYDFNHDKIREVVYHELSGMRRVLLHRHVAEALETPDTGRVGTLAEHFEKGEIWAKAIPYLFQAAGRARQLFAMQEALRYYDRAIALAERHPDVAAQSQLLDLYEQRGETRGLVGGQVSEAVADLERVLDEVREAGNPVREQGLLIRIGQVYRYGDRYHEALKYLKAALEVARRGGDARHVADALYHLGATVWSQGYNDQALVYHREAVDICQSLDLADLVAVQAYHGLGEAFFLAGRAEEAIALYEKSLELARQIQDKSYESENLGNMGMALQLYGLADYDRAKELFRRAVKISQSAHLEWHASQELGPLGFAYSLSGDYKQGLTYLNRSLELAASIGARRFQSNLLDMQGMIWQELNLLDRAKAAHEQAIQLAEQAGAGWWLPRIQANLAIDRLRLGNLSEVEETLQAALAHALQHRLEIHAVRCLEGLAELALVQGQPQQAIQYAKRLQAVAEPGKMREVMAQAHRWRGEALLASGELEAATAELKQALALAEAIGRPRLKWDIHALLVKVYRARGDEALAAQHETRVKQIIGHIAANLQDPALQIGLGLEAAALHSPGGVPKTLITVEIEADQQSAGYRPGPHLTSPQQRFVQERLIASGGMGEVYRGWDVETGQWVAIKRLRPELAAQNPHAVERLLREGEILRQLNHPNIVRVLATVETEAQPVIVMEYVSGGSLQTLLEQQSQLPLDRVLKLGLELADALARVHHLDIIHRDLKPANILLAEDGAPRLTDFGVAYLATQATRLTREGDILGTTFYMSPEAWRSEELDARSDVWSFGAILYEMLAGQPPFAAKQIVAIMRAILNDPVPNLYRFRPDAPPALVALIEQMLVKERELRIDSMRQVAAGLEIIRRS
jgi:tetratricopeptide (TPR) repeat protein/tRNA A-37 threonylcarbamoyl transferase component Bud32